jgi:hypothetical protein
MDELERYLDRVCRSVGGPRAMRQHIRRELRDHLLDAVARQQAKGLSPEQALEQALAEFGGPDEMRSELETAHGHRTMAVVLDKAMQWKENTMKARWLWASWAYLGLVLVIALEVLFITCTLLFIVPKFQLLLRDGLIDPAVSEQVPRLLAFLGRLSAFTDSYTTLVVLAVAVAWGVFEWRVRSENKPLMRMSALGSVAVALMVVVWLTAAALLVPFCLGVPATGKLARSFALDQILQIDSSVTAIEGAIGSADWPAIERHSTQVAKALGELGDYAPALPALAGRNQSPTIDELRQYVKRTSQSLLEAQQSIPEHDAAVLSASVAKLRAAYAPLLETARTPM